MGDEKSQSGIHQALPSPALIKAFPFSAVPGVLPPTSQPSRRAWNITEVLTSGAPGSLHKANTSKKHLFSKYALFYSRWSVRLFCLVSLQANCGKTVLGKLWGWVAAGWVTVQGTASDVLRSNWSPTRILYSCCWGTDKNICSDVSIYNVKV